MTFAVAVEPEGRADVLYHLPAELLAPFKQALQMLADLDEGEIGCGE